MAAQIQPGGKIRKYIILKDAAEQCKRECKWALNESHPVMNPYYPLQECEVVEQMEYLQERIKAYLQARGKLDTFLKAHEWVKKVDLKGTTKKRRK